ncbi:MAG: peptide ABC transporter substrate-binding protein [Firmicutes bacterium]|nr:peptide ABC transporter substrate-binding protein [Bacillota bacterium]
MRRKILISIIVAAFAISFAGVACARENVVRFPFPDIPSFNPIYWQAQHILAQGTIYEGLFGYAPDPGNLGEIKVVPAVAEKYTYSQDGKTWTITLKRGKKWSNGDPVTARDFEWSFRYYASPALPDVPYWASPLQYVKNAWAVKGGSLPPEQLGVKALDDYTLQFTLDRPRFDFHCWLAIGGAAPVHRKTVEAYPNDWWKPEHFVGNGPYVVKSWTPGKECVLVKNLNYVGECGNVDKVVLKFGGLGLQAYEAGELDLAWITNVGEFKYVKANRELSKHFKETLNDLFWQGYQISRGFSPVLDNKKLRMALAMAIDREALVKTVLGGRAIATGSYWTKNDPIGANLKEIPYDPEQAKKLLAEAGYPNGSGLPVLKFYITGASNPVAEFLVDQWKRNLGIKVAIENIESGLYWSTYVWGNYAPDAGAGFTLIGAPMNSFSGEALFKNACHTMWFYDMPASIRKKSYELEQEWDAFLRKEGGQTDADWKAILDKKAKLVASKKEILAKEPDKLWREAMSIKPTFDEQVDDLYEKWQKARDANQKTEYWRQANRVLISEEELQLQYLGMNETNRMARRIHNAAGRLPFEEAMKIVPKGLQIILDQAYMVPLYTDKIQYVQRPNLEGVMIYKFSWGPQVFNFKYLKVK